MILSYLFVEVEVPFKLKDSYPVQLNSVVFNQTFMSNAFKVFYLIGQFSYFTMIIWLKLDLNKHTHTHKKKETLNQNPCKQKLFESGSTYNQGKSAYLRYMSCKGNDQEGEGGSRKGVLQ